MCQISKTARKAGFDSYISFGRGDDSSEEKAIKIGTHADIYWHGLVTRLTSKHGFSSTETAIYILSIDIFAVVCSL